MRFSLQLKQALVALQVAAYSRFWNRRCGAEPPGDEPELVDDSGERTLVVDLLLYYILCVLLFQVLDSVFSGQFIRFGGC